MKSMGLKMAVKKTIKYAAKFESYVNKREIKERLISKKIYSEEEIRRVLKELSWKNKRNEWYESKLNKAKNLAEKIKVDFGEILFLGVSGSVASGHPKKDDDIDLLIITKANKLWKNRLKLRWWMFKKGIPHRKYEQKEEGDEFCFNLWLDENYLLLPSNRQNLKNSIDLILLKPLINKESVYEKFILANSWAKKWVATPYFDKIQDIRSEILDKKVKQNIFDKVMNYLYFGPQYGYMRLKIKGETIGLHQAFFHRQMVK